jgi:hypothetical protein
MYLGMLASLLGKHDLADEHFKGAGAVHDRAVRRGAPALNGLRDEFAAPARSYVQTPKRPAPVRKEKQAICE